MMLRGVMMLIGVLGGNALSAAELYRWSDDRGGAVYADRLPPDKVREGHAVLDRQGRELRNLPPEASPEERAERAQKADVARERSQLEAELARRDGTLRQLYASEAAILQARDARLEGLDAQRHVMTRQLVAHRDRLAMLEHAHPDDEEIPSLRKRIAEGDTVVADLLRERARVEMRYAADLDRWRQIRPVSRIAPRTPLNP